jgi:hypothetical protein
MSIVLLMVAAVVLAWAWVLLAPLVEMGEVAARRLRAWL